MAKSDKLRNAKQAQNDEFYTQLSDISEELRHYREHFKNKIVLCNCDDPYESNFFKYFAMNFEFLGLKKLIATCFDGSPVVGTQLDIFNYDCFNDVSKTKAFKIEIVETPDFNGDGAVDLTDVETLLKSDKNVLTVLNENGDFKSDECISLLKEADIVVTNPPFSEFREYVSQLIKYNKKFLILANMNCLTYKDFFPLVKDNKIWAGYGFNLSMVFKTPYPNLLDSNRKYVTSKGYDPDDGYVKVPSICWFTNLDIKKRHENLIMYRTYDKNNYPSYYNYDGIDCKKVEDIPIDYFGNIGVPITFLDKYNPEQFEIIGLGTEVEKNILHTTAGNEIHFIDKSTNEIIYRVPYSVSERKAGNSLWKNHYP